MSAINVYPDALCLFLFPTYSGHTLFAINVYPDALSRFLLSTSSGHTLFAINVYPDALSRFIFTTSSGYTLFAIDVCPDALYRFIFPTTSRYALFAINIYLMARKGAVTTHAARAKILRRRPLIPTTRTSGARGHNLNGQTCLTPSTATESGQRPS